jgi:DNA-binding CsgD family transcriptional regulator
MPHAERWAGMGRMVELPCGAAGALLGVALLQRLPVSLTFLVYVILLVVSGAMFYQVMVGWYKNANCTIVLATVETTENGAGASVDPPSLEKNIQGEQKESSLTKDESPFTHPSTKRKEAVLIQETDPTAPITESSGPTELGTTEFTTTNFAKTERAVPVAAAASISSQPELSPVFNMTPEQLEKQLRIFKRFYRLTRRETEVLQELIWERSIQEISERLNISQRTVKYHISNLFQKTDVKTQKELKRTLRRQKRRFEKGLDPLPPDEYEEDE